MNIDEVQACRGLDALIAEKVMGLRNVRNTSSGPVYDITEKFWLATLVPFYSTNIADAWQVTERLSGKWDLRRTIPHTQWRVFYQPQEPVSLGFEAVATTAPLAICRAALKAVG